MAVVQVQHVVCLADGRQPMSDQKHAARCTPLAQIVHYPKFGLCIEGSRGLVQY